MPALPIYTQPMRSRFRAVLSYSLAAAVLLAAGVLALEVGSRRYQSGLTPGPRSGWPVCDPERYPPRPEKLRALDELTGKQVRGERITRVDLDRAAVLAPQEDMPGLNGVYCQELIYVSERLPLPARRYVARHELEHVFQARGAVPETRDHELAATWRAGFHHPFGLIVTILSSLQEGCRSAPSFQAFLFGSWEVFKMYMVP